LGLNTETITLSPSDREAATFVWEELWNILYDVGYRSEKGQEQRFEMWVAATGALWGVARVCKTRLVAQDSQIRSLIEFYGKISDDDVRVKCIGTLESLAQTPYAIEQNQLISEFLFSLLDNISLGHSQTCIHSVSAIIDIYSDEEAPYDKNFRFTDRLTRLKEIQMPLRKLVRSIDRRKSGGRALRHHGEEVLVNLSGFIQYREKLCI